MHGCGAPLLGDPGSRVVRSGAGGAVGVLTHGKSLTPQHPSAAGGHLAKIPPDVLPPGVLPPAATSDPAPVFSASSGSRTPSSA